MHMRNFTGQYRVRLAVLSALVIFSSTCASAQQSRAALFGNVSDSTGAAVAGASVVLINTNTNLEYPATTNESGNYILNDLPVGGGYRLNVSQSGFRKSVRNGLTLEVDQRAQIDVRLEVGTVSEELIVTGDMPLIDTGTATVGKVIEARAVEELPVDGRSALSLVLLAPSVQSAFGPDANGFADRGLVVSAIRINGSPIASNNLIVDGLSSINPYVPDVNVNPVTDAVQEFKVQTNTMSSEYGFTLGGVVNLVTKGGTNQFHGSLYHYLRNNAVDANSWTANRTARPKLPLRYNHFGGTLGGPIRIPKLYNGANRSFFFFNYDGYRYVTSTSGFYTMPTAAQSGGDFSGLYDGQSRKISIFDPATTTAGANNSGTSREAFPNNVIPASRIDPVAKNINAFYPLPNRTPDNDLTNLNNYYGAVSGHKRMNQSTTRLDHRFTDRHNISGRYIYYLQFTDQGTGNLYPSPVIRGRNDPFGGHNIVISDSYVIRPNLFHEFRIGLARQNFGFAVPSADGGWAQKVGLPANVPPDVFPNISNGLPGFSTGTVGFRGGLVWQLYDGFNWVHGNHSVKFGTELHLIQANNLQKSNPSGTFNFSSALTNNALANTTATGYGFATYLLGQVSSATVTTHLGESEVGKSASLYVNDDWRVNRRLTVNAGVRYDFQQQPYERRCGTSRFNPFATNQTNGLQGLTEYACQDYGRTSVHEHFNDLAPRIGFAWDVFGNQRTALRGGYSIFYPSLWSFYTDNFGSTNGFATTNTVYNPPGGSTVLPAFQFKDGFPSTPNQPLGSKLGPNLFATSGSAAYQEPNSRIPMSQQWSLSIQRRLSPTWMVDASYSANHSTHLIGGPYDYNQIDPALLSQYGLLNQLNNQIANPYVGKVPGTFGAATITRRQASLIYPYVSTITIHAPHLGNSNYNALLTSVEKRLSPGARLLSSFTWGKLISDTIANPLNFGGGEGTGTFGYQNGKYNRVAERAEDPSNVPYRLTISGIFEVPNGRGQAWRSTHRALSNFISGWQLNTVTTLSSGQPLVIKGASNGMADRPNLLRSPDLPADFVDANPGRGIQWFDTQAFSNPSLYTWGNAPRSISTVRQPAAIIINASMFKTFVVTEKLKLQFRGEAFNAPNHTNYSAANGSFTAGTNGLNANDAFGRITSARDPRRLQFALKLLF